jgi:hypothetical protein
MIWGVMAEPELAQSHIKIGRGEKIRTSGPCLPKAVLYQAELHPDALKIIRRTGRRRGVTLAEASISVDLEHLEIRQFDAICYSIIIL